MVALRTPYAAYGQAVHAQRRLPNPNRNRLAILAADTDATVEFQVVADHGDLLQY